jgi:hypothetical protein
MHCAKKTKKSNSEKMQKQKLCEGRIERNTPSISYVILLTLIQISPKKRSITNKVIRKRKSEMRQKENASDKKAARTRAKYKA